MHANFINGEWIEGVDIRVNISPSDLSDVIGDYSQADAVQAAQAIGAANAAADAWARSTGQQRADMLDFVGTEILARKQELGRLLSREEGKTLADGIGEVSRAGAIFKYFAGEAIRIQGEKLPVMRPGIEADVTREPVGVVGIISPWNFPIAIPAWKIAPALAYGNTVVFKPADLVPGCAWELAEIISRAGFAPGVFNLVMGRGSVVGQAILDHKQVDAISFTGSVTTGRRVAESAIKRLAKVQMEMGGKNPLVVLDDADLQTAVDCAIQGAFFQTGQRCTASSRLIVQKGIYPRFLDAMKARMQQLTVDNALKPGVEIGPVVDETQLNQNERYISIAKEEGARLVLGGERLERDTEGYYFSPALFADCHNDMRIAREEVFGPVAAMIAVDSYEDALAVANDTEFGLSAGICTSSLKYASHFKRNSQVGMVMVNCATAGVDYHVPFGGRKGSSYGPREQGRYAAEFYTTVKTSYTAV
ncbi:aldehyde dehydrogenase family protein [Pollutimonas bauzanensis]|uniref:aldehyde dehydrogenase family protein n=1 Tax=Pollutimonas bauzanensis TaxID=658167 RepID=UPI0033414C7F